ncbi:hypothetical protein HPP92_013616 [Vanilla planifolia]|uniref:Uncharacterized protein n=1 Tax=Vanilla planifolia TaxID=51239 RepID=A0A835QV30_VANPL|nr:hypothetical protein HPP92_013616 [Vanilla planifolia]
MSFRFCDELDLILNDLLESFVIDMNLSPNWVLLGLFEEEMDIITSFNSFINLFFTENKFFAMFAWPFKVMDLWMVNFGGNIMALLVLIYPTFSLFLLLLSLVDILLQ